MKRPRFSIRGLSVVVFVAALGLYLLKIVVDDAEVVLTAVILIITVSFPLAMISRGRLGAFLTGFAIFGATYLAISSSPIHQFLPTETLTEELAERWLPASDALRDLDVVDEFGTPPLSRHKSRIRLACRALTTMSLASFGGVALSLLVSCRKVVATPLDPPAGSLCLPVDWRKRLIGLWED